MNRTHHMAVICLCAAGTILTWISPAANLGSPQVDAPIPPRAAQSPTPPPAPPNAMAPMPEGRAPSLFETEAWSVGGLNGEWRLALQPPSDPAELELMAEQEKLLRALRKAEKSEDERQALEQLRDNLRAQFERRLKQREKQVEDLAQRLEKLREQLGERRRSKDEIVELRLRTIVNEAKGLGF